MENPRNEEDEKLFWSAFRGGDEKALFYFYDAYFKNLFGYGKRFTKDEFLVKDCIQDLFVEMWDKREKLDTIYSPKFYFMKCLRRRILSTLSQGMARPICMEVPEDYHFEVTLSHENFLIESSTSLEIQEKVHDAYNKLSKRQKEAVFLKFYEKLSYTEIAEIMGLKEVKYARTMVYRSLDHLRLSLCLDPIFN